ncbi:hypothetical protein [Nocardia sp. NPDC051832]|uniref:hypothetical protein n=1 Tax=Nocardia sp. NPDC051832 TaxID=3155673 RepID=UPI003429A0A0
MAELESRVAKLEVRMDIGGARDSATLTVIGNHLAALDTKLDQVHETVINLAIKVEALENRFDGQENRLDGLENRLDGLENRLDGLDTKLDEVLRRLPPPQD